MDLASDMGKVKARWDRAFKRDFDIYGNEVTEPGELEQKKSVDEHLEEQSHRERFRLKDKTMNFGGTRASDVKSNPW